MTVLTAFPTVFVATVIEMVEALTVVLAVGIARGCGATGIGVLVGLAALLLFVAVLGPAISAIPTTPVRILAGLVSLTIGLHWLRKAILRASGYHPLRDERAAFRRHTERARSDGGPNVAGLDRYALAASSKAVLLEGLEVVVIVVGFGGARHAFGIVAVAAICALIVVVAAAVAVRGPLARVPENTMKFVAGWALVGIGLYWAGDGGGVRWPGSELALLGLITLVGISSRVLVGHLRRGPIAAARRIRA